MLTVLCWLWTQDGGRTSYGAEHVNIWAAMVTRHLSIPHRLACVTAHPEGIRPDVRIIPPPGDFEDVELPTWAGPLPQCLRRIALFRPDAAEIFGDRFVSMDIDCVVADSLDPLFDRPEDIVLYRGTNFNRPYNGSMLMMTAGARPRVYTECTPERLVEAGRRYLGSDQAWFSHALGSGESTWGSEHGVAWFGSQYNRGKRLMFFPGKPKPWDLVGWDGWVTEHYRGSRGGRLLSLGYGPNVWADLDRAEGPFDAVVASPEAARHVRADHVAESDLAAAQWARMHGFPEVVWCGRTEAVA